MQNDYPLNAPLKEYKYPVIFFSLAICVPWLLWTVGAYTSRLQTSNIALESFLTAVGLLIPSIVGFTMVFLNADLRKDFLYNKILNFKKVKPTFLLTAIFFPFLSILLAQLISILFGYSISQFAFSKSLLNSIGFIPMWVIFIQAPVFEELGWRSYGIDSLRARFSLFTTTIIFTFLWGFWHTPLFFIKGYILTNISSHGFIYTANYFVSMFCCAFLLNWLYFKANRNIFIPMIFHFTIDLAAELFATAPMSKVIWTATFALAMLIIMVTDRGFVFSAHNRNL